MRYAMCYMRDSCNKFRNAESIFHRMFLTTMVPGGRLNKKDRLTGYGDSHVKDKTSYRPSYL